MPASPRLTTLSLSHSLVGSHTYTHTHTSIYLSIYLSLSIYIHLSLYTCIIYYHARESSPHNSLFEPFAGREP